MGAVDWERDLNEIDYTRLARALIEGGLATAIADALRPHLAALPLAPATDLLTKDELAHALKVSPQTVSRALTKGLPVEYVGDLPRFDLGACRTWLAAQERPPTRRSGSSKDLDLDNVRVTSRKK